MKILIIVLGIIGVFFLLGFGFWFVKHPISRDRVLMKLDKTYFWLLICIVFASILVIAGLIELISVIGSFDFLSKLNLECLASLSEAVKYCTKMGSPKNENVWLSVLVMLFQIVVFEGLIIAAIVGWTGRRTKMIQKGQVRYSKEHLNGKFVSLWDTCDKTMKWYQLYWNHLLCYVKCLKSSVQNNSYAVVIGANEVAPSVIKNLLKHEDEKKNSLNYAHEKENKYVILQTCSEIEEVRQTLKAYLTEEEYDHIIISSDIRYSYEGLKALHLDEASEIYVLGENTTIDGGETYHDTMNMRCVNIMAQILGNRGDDLKVCKVLFEYQTTYSVFQFSDVTQEVNQAMHFIPFNRYESWARRVMVDNKALALVDENTKQSKQDDNIITYTPLDGYKGIKFDSPQHVHFIVIGMSKMGIAMGTQALFQAHYPNFANVQVGGPRSRITFIDANAEQEMLFYKGRYATLFELARHRYIDANTCAKSELESNYGWVDPTELSNYKWAHLSKAGKNFLDVEIEFVKGELESEGIREYLRRVTADKNSKVTIAICLPLTHQAVAAALYMPQQVYDSVQEIWVYQREAADIIRNLTHDRADNHYNKLKPFGMLYGEYIDSRTYYLKSLIVNELYNLRKNTSCLVNLDMGKKNLYKNLRTCWNELTVEKKWSNKYFSDLIYQKIRSIMPYVSDEAARGGYGNEIYSQSDWQACLEKALVHAPGLDQCEHNRWNIQQLLLGFIPADKEIDEKVQNKKGELTNDELKKYKKDLKSPKNKVHYCICDFDHIDKVDAEAKEYDEMLNNGIPLILAHVDGYCQEAWYIMKMKAYKILQ